MEAAELAKTAHACRHAAKPLQGVQVVQALVEQDTTASPFQVARQSLLA
jgi:hypothetical protein